MIELAEVIKKHGPEYLEKFGDRMPHNHKRALFAITACRTEVTCEFHEANRRRNGMVFLILLTAVTQQSSTLTIGDDESSPQNIALTLYSVQAILYLRKCKYGVENRYG